MNGLPCSSTRVKSSSPAVTTGLRAKASSACAEEASSWFSAVAARRFTAPRAKAWPSGGATVTSERALGRSRRMNSALFSIKGASKGSENVACSSEAGPSAVASSSCLAAVAQAAKNVS